jgi:hypothetical protein
MNELREVLVKKWESYIEKMRTGSIDFVHESTKDMVRYHIKMAQHFISDLQSLAVPAVAEAEMLRSAVERALKHTGFSDWDEREQQWRDSSIHDSLVNDVIHEILAAQAPEPSTGEQDLPKLYSRKEMNDYGLRRYDTGFEAGKIAAAPASLSTGKRIKSRPYRDFMREQLSQDPALVMDYLKEAQEGSAHDFVKALRRVLDVFAVAAADPASLSTGRNEVSEQEWFNPYDKRPPDGVVVDTLNSAGQMTQLVLKGNMWWFADMSMYIYYVPKFWRIPPEAKHA